MTNHGPHHNCLMCRMARTVGMVEKHPKDCDCESNTKENGEEKEKVKVKPQQA